MFLTYIAKIWKVVDLTMQSREQLCSDYAQKLMESAGRADAVEHNDHDDQFLNELPQHLRKRSCQC